MKRSSVYRDESTLVNNNASNSFEFREGIRNNEGVSCNIIEGFGGDNLSADIVVSTPITNESNASASEDLFLNQTSYGGNGRARRNTNVVKKSRRRSLKHSEESKTNYDHVDADLSSLIASELTKLSIEDRVKALEEVHGVVENIEEDPEVINNLFEQVKEELKRIRYKQAYEKTAFLSNAYVNDPEFVLPFLRADNYKPRPAAIRLTEHFRHKLDLFGERTLVRDIMYDDLTDDEKLILNSGFVQIMTAKDQAGRQIVVCNMSVFLKVGNLRNVLRACWYLTVRNAKMNSANYKMGIVGVYFAHGMANIFEKLAANKKDFIEGTGFMQNALPLKFASVHFCFDNTFGSSLQTYLMMSLGKCARVRLRSHCGSIMECRYALKSFGIHVDSFANGSLTDSVQEVIKCFRELDEVHRKKMEKKVLPRPNDVLLGRGRPFQLYSGNLALTAMIDQNRTRYTTAKKMDKKAITSEIVESIRKSGGMFLKKAVEGSDVDWEEVDFETSRLKVSHSFRTMSRCHAGQDDLHDAWNPGGKGNEGLPADPIPSTLTDVTNPLGLLVEVPLSNVDPLAADTGFASSNKRRKG